MADEIRIDARELKSLSRDILRVGEETIVEVPAELGVNARALANQAKNIAASYQSSGVSTGGAQAVADSVKASARTRSEWVVEAGGPNVPLAGLWELGNKRSNPEAPTFRHPVYGGTAPWQNQRKWRFLTMALHQYEPIAFGRFQRLVDTILRRNRL